MKRSLYLVTLVLMLIPSFLYAQKDAPVAGHAAALTDLLKKDYSASDPEQRETDISRDRTQVIAIFKSYLTDDQHVKLKTDSFAAYSKKLKGYQNEISLKKKQLDLYIAQGGKDQKTLGDAALIAEGLENSRQGYDSTKTKMDLDELQAIKDQLTKNNFLEDAVDLFIVKFTSLKNNTMDLRATSNTVSTVQKSIPFIGGALTFETVIDGLGRFLAKRIKEELTTYVLGRIKNWLENPDPNDPLTELKVLLPKTTGYLVGFNADQITNFPNEIKQYIEDDLNHLLDNAGNLRNTPRIGALISKYPDLDFAFEALELIPDISKIKNPVDYFTFLENSRNISRWKNDKESKIKFNIANGIYLTALLSRSLVVIDNGEKRFAGTEFLTAYAQEDIFFILYGGFLHQQNLKYYEVSFITKDDTAPVELAPLFKRKILDSLNNIKQNRLFFTELITQAAKNAEKVFNTAADIRKANKAGIKPGADTVYSFIKSIIAFSQETTTAADKLVGRLMDSGRDVEPIHLSQLTQPYFTIANTTNDVIYDIQRKKYTTALIKALDISSDLFKNTQLTLASNLMASIENIRTNDLQSWVSVTKPIVDSISPAVDSTRKKAFTTISTQLDDIKKFHTRNYTADSTLSIYIATFINTCQDTTSQLDVKKLDSIRTLIKTPGFKKLVISFYANKVLDKELVRLKAELVSVRIKKPDGTPIPLFIDAEADTILKVIGEFAEAFCTNYFITGFREKGLDMIATRKALTDTLRSYMLKLPQKLDLQMSPRVISLVHFVNDMAVAQDAEGVEKAIEAFALPAGSYAIKRKATSNFSLNSYPGILAAYEITPLRKKLLLVSALPHLLV